MELKRKSLKTNLTVYLLPNQAFSCLQGVASYYKKVHWCNPKNIANPGLVWLRIILLQRNPANTNSLSSKSSLTETKADSFGFDPLLGEPFSICKFKLS